jgi:hypothetical protein
MAPLRVLAALAVATGPAANGAAGANPDFEALARIQGGPVRIAPDPPPPREPLPDVAVGPVPKVPTIRAVITRERASLWECRAELRGARRFVLDLSIPTNGRVRDLRLRPDAPPALEACALAAALRWRFPRFTGERPDGRTVEIVNVSVPIAFAANGPK